jgi:hypothetical protein
MKLKITVFWDMTPCSFVTRYQRFGGTCSSETLVSVYQTTRRHIALDCNSRSHHLYYLLSNKIIDLRVL